MGNTITRLVQEELGANPRYGHDRLRKPSRGPTQSRRSERRTSQHSSAQNATSSHADRKNKNSKKRPPKSAHKHKIGESNQGREKQHKSTVSRPQTKGKEAANPVSRNVHEIRSENQKAKGRKSSKSRTATTNSKRSKKPQPARNREIPADTPNRKNIDDDQSVSSYNGGHRKECIACTSTRSHRHFPKRPPTASCTHEPNVCKQCLRGWIQSEFTTKVWDQMNCPECLTRMQFDDMKAFAPRGIFRQYEKLSTKAALEAIPGFRWCIAKGCKSGQVHDASSATPKFVCGSCKHQHCVVHNVRWHRGETCAEYDYRIDGSLKKAEEDASKKWIKKASKKCPGCKWNIEKNYGCDHMTCVKCRHEFCWQCLAPYQPIRDQGNRLHRPECSHHA